MDFSAKQISVFPIWKAIITWILRILAGGVFIFSGFVKAVDPWGTIFKMQEYFSALHFDIASGLVEVLVFFMIAFEFLAGLFVLLGCYRRGGPMMIILFMIAMLPLTLWIWIKEPVSDCGCFGDAIILSNAETFWKNVVITLMGVWLLIYEKKTKALVSPAIQWIVMVSAIVYIGIISLDAFFYQPQIDFRPYPVGSKLISDSGEEIHYKFIYEKDGIKKEFNENDLLPDENNGWRFIDRIEIKENKGNKLTLNIRDEELTIYSGEEDVTQDVVSEDGKQLILFAPSLKDVGMSNSWVINSLASYSEKNNIDFICIVSGSEKDIEEWEDSSMADYPIYTADDTQIKEVVRGNPGLVYLTDGVIRWKSTLSALETTDFMDENVSPDPLTFNRDNFTFLKNISYIFIIILSVLIGLSIIPYRKLFLRKRKSNDDDRDLHLVS